MNAFNSTENPVSDLSSPERVLFEEFLRRPNPFGEFLISECEINEEPLQTIRVELRKHSSLSIEEFQHYCMQLRPYIKSRQKPELFLLVNHMTDILLERVEMFQHLMKFQVWNEFDFVVAISLYQRLTIDDKMIVNTSGLLDIVISSYKVRELLSINNELAKLIVGAYMQVDNLIELHQAFKSYFITSSACKSMLENVVNYFVPVLKQKLGFNGPRFFLQVMNDKFLSTEARRFIYLSVLRHIPLEQQERDVIMTFPLASLTSQEVEILFEILLKIRHRDYLVGDWDVQTLTQVDLIAQAKQPFKLYFKFFVSHLVLAINDFCDSPIAQQYVTIIDTMVRMALQFMHDSELADVGAKIYIDVYKTVYESHYKLHYAFKFMYFPYAGSPACVKLGHLRDLKLDILYLSNHMNYETLVPFVDIMWNLPQCPDIVPGSKLIQFYFEGITDLYKERESRALMRLLMNKYFCNAGYTMQVVMMYFHFTNVDNSELLDILNNMHYPFYLYLIGLVTCLKVTEMPDAFIRSALRRSMSIIDFIREEEQIFLHNENVSKYCERILALSAELMVHCASQVDMNGGNLIQILTQMEKAMFFNRRFSSTAISGYIRDFIKAHFSSNKDIFTRFFLQRLALVELPDQDDQCYIRRSFSFKHIVGEIMEGSPRAEHQMLVDFVFKALLGTAYATSKAFVCVKALDTIEYLMRNATFKENTEKYILPALLVAFYNYNVPDFRVRNAAINTIAGTTTRLLPGYFIFNISLNDLFTLYPNLVLIIDKMFLQPGDPDEIIDIKLAFLNIFSNASNNGGGRFGNLVTRAALSYFYTPKCFPIIPCIILARSVPFLDLEVFFTRHFSYPFTNNCFTLPLVTMNLHVINELKEIIDKYDSYVRYSTSEKFRHELNVFKTKYECLKYKIVHHLDIELDMNRQDWANYNFGILFANYEIRFILNFIHEYKNELEGVPMHDFIHNLLIKAEVLKDESLVTTILKMAIEYLVHNRYKSKYDKLIGILLVIIPKYDFPRLGYVFENYVTLDFAASLNYSPFTAFFITFFARFPQSREYFSNDILMECYDHYLIIDNTSMIMAFKSFRAICGDKLKNEILFIIVFNLILTTPFVSSGIHVYILDALDLPSSMSICDVLKHIFTNRYLSNYFGCVRAVQTFVTELEYFMNNFITPHKERNPYIKEYIDCVDSALNALF